MRVDDETWAAVRTAYADAAVPLKEIAARFGLTPQRIGSKAKKDGWTGRAPSRKAHRASAKPSPDASSNGSLSDKQPKAPAAAKTRAKRSRGKLPTRDARKSIVGRLYRAISLKLEHMEKRMASGEPRSAQDEERESRALATLINNFEKITEAVAELDQDGGAAHAASAAGSDAERMRREITERLERLGGSGALERGTRKSG